MIGHRAYLDNPRLVTTTARKPPIPFGHRKWLAIARIEARWGETGNTGSTAKPRKPEKLQTPSGDNP